jgi:hypothetical protein
MFVVVEKITENTEEHREHSLRSYPVYTVVNKNYGEYGGAGCMTTCLNFQDGGEGMLPSVHFYTVAIS